MNHRPTVRIFYLSLVALLTNALFTEAACLDLQDQATKSQEQPDSLTVIIKDEQSPRLPEAHSPQPAVLLEVTDTPTNSQGSEQTSFYKKPVFWGVALGMTTLIIIFATGKKGPTRSNELPDFPEPPER